MHTAAPQPNLNPADPAIEQSVFFWLAVIVTGVTAGIAGGALMRLLYFVEHTAWSYNSAHVFLYAVTRASAARRICNLALAGILVGLVGALLRWLFKPGPDLETAIWFRSGQIPLVSTLTKAVLAIVSVGLGTCLGRESPIKQTGGALASAVARLGKLSPQQRQLLVACGVGAGMASAYNVPLGGGLFTVEVLIGSMSLQVVMPALACSAVATAASWLLLPISPIYTVGEFQMDWPLLVWAVLVGPLMGWAAVAVIRSIDWA
jgi:H+/Cl- antiporter ClcA